MPFNFYGHTGVIITTNLIFPALAGVFGDTKITTMSSDRLTLHCNITETGKDSFRYNGSVTKTKTRKAKSTAT
ncbi:MAG: ATP-binding protein [Acidocella sp.]|nr:ATP-binding protein [Acidocella sp.]